MQRDSDSTECAVEGEGKTVSEVDALVTLRAAFLDSMASNSTSVHVVTTGSGDQRFGVTVSACSSVCADPPTLLVCINTRSPANAAVAENGVFAVNLLNVAQRGIADTFAGRSATAKPFDFSCCATTRHSSAAAYWHAHGVFRRSSGRYPRAGDAHALALLQARLRPILGLLDAFVLDPGMNAFPNDI